MTHGVYPSHGKTVEEDYRVKNAREGRAFYMPGKSIGEIEAARHAQSLADHEPVYFAMGRKAATNAEVFVGDMPHFLTDMANGLELLQGGIETGGIDADHPGLTGTLRAFQTVLRMRADEIEPICDDLGNALRSVPYQTGETA